MDEVKRRGRPPGSRNKERLVPVSTKQLADYQHADPDTIISRQLVMLDVVQQQLRNELNAHVNDGTKFVDVRMIQALERLANSIVRTVEALKKSADLTTELAARMTPEQLLEAALKKIEGQDTATLNYAIKRLRAHRERLAPVAGFDKMQMGEPATATAAIAGLTDDVA